MPVYLIGTLDTKGREIGFVRDLLGEYGVDSCVLDAGCLGDPAIPADVSREQVFEAAGTTLEEVLSARDRGRAVTTAAEGAAAIIAAESERGNVNGVLGLGGSAGTTIATEAMRRLPLGVPKLMVSTLASGQTRPYVGDKDILMLNPVVDISGMNRITRTVLTQAARAMAGLVTLQRSDEKSSSQPGGENDKPLIAATMFGVTTPCVERARQVLEEAGYEVLVFHATGTGGQAMESLIRDGLIAGVLDITTTELADELVGGVLSAGPDRLTAAGLKGIPQVISVGATDMVNFGPPDTVPEKFADRTFYHHNPTVTLMRTTVEESRRIGEEIGRKAAAAAGPTVIILPLRGVSAIDADGQPFDDPAARDALFSPIRDTAAGVKIIERDEHINDEAFADAAARALLEMIR
ncbi:MAG: UPF0261 family protein [Planctomycetota bacterium]|nr:MAG: UPF0261 family protein [Planctomycetota bacterium]REJ95506.1 MAG: UPF0261 family protein [Planctomycetota bacterium]REK27251.1 MAG: UPF0261 family protein [Planctomycetota bacterium]REK36727.1 MAG: UPF0261 family protein [Planctomycetota bacterium]